MLTEHFFTYRYVFTSVTTSLPLSFSKDEQLCIIYAGNYRLRSSDRWRYQWLFLIPHFEHHFVTRSSMNELGTDNSNSNPFHHDTAPFKFS